MPSFQLHDTCVESLWTNSKNVHEFPSMHERHSTGQKEDKIVVYNSPLRSCLIQDSTSNLINEYMIKPLELDLYISLNPQHKTFEITYKVWWWPWKTRFWKPSVNSMYFSEQRSDKDNSTQILTFSAYGRFIKKLFKFPCTNIGNHDFTAVLHQTKTRVFGALSLSCNTRYSGATAVFKV